jgi:transporter family protein
VFAALTAIFAKVGVAEVGSDFTTVVRTLVVVVALAGLLVATGQWQSPDRCRRAAMSSLSCPVLARAHRGLLLPPPAARRRGARRTIDKLGVVFVAIFAFLFLGEKLAALNWIGIALIGAGAVPVAF